MELRDNGKLEYHLPEDALDFIEIIKIETTLNQRNMNIDIIIEVDEFPPYDHSPFDPYQDTISVGQETYSKIMEYCKNGIFVLREMNIPELMPIIEEWEEEVKEEASDRFSFSDEADFIEPKVTVKVDEYFYENSR